MPQRKPLFAVAGGFQQVAASDQIAFDASAATVTPADGPSASVLAQHLFEGLRATNFLIRPYLTDLTGAIDQTNNLILAISAAPAGARLMLPPGVILFSGTLTITGCQLHGVGRSQAGTELRYSSASGPALKVMGDGAAVSNFLMTNPVSNSNAVAIQFADGVTNPRGQMIDQVRAVGFQDQLDIQSGEFWSAARLDFYNAARYGVRIRNGYNVDSGDGSISQSSIYADNPIGVSAIRIESGGGLKISTTKILQFAKGVDLAAVDGAITSDLFVSETVSIENQYDTGVSLGRAPGGTTGSYINIVVAAQFAGAPASIQVHDGVGNVSLRPIISSANYGVIIDGGYNIDVADGTPMQNIGVNTVVIKNAPVNVSIGRINGVTVASGISDQRTQGAAGVVNLNDVHPISALAYNSKPKLLYSIGIPAYRGARISVQVEGILSGAGAVNTLLDILAINNGTSVQPPTTVSNVQGGQVPIDILFDTSTTAGQINVGVRVNSNYQSSTFNGSATLRVDGRTSSFAIG